MTGDELKDFRIATGLSQRALAEMAAVHPDTVRYWEHKARVNLRGWAPDRMLRALGKGDLVERHTFPARRALAASEMPRGKEKWCLLAAKRTVVHADCSGSVWAVGEQPTKAKPSTNICNFISISFR
jgi:hypothetical protein